MHPDEFSGLYQHFDASLMVNDCGERCSPHNQYGVPFCCDIHHAIPTAYLPEWDYLKQNSNLWHLYRSEDIKTNEELNKQLPDGQVLIECQGHLLCQRNFRSIVCRSFPFFPYLNRQGEFLGLSYYWEYEDRCWVISNLDLVSAQYRDQFVETYAELFDRFPQERENFRSFSILMRQVFGRKKRAIPLLHRNGFCYKVSPRNGRLRRSSPNSFIRFGPYKIAAQLPFPDEIA